MYCRQAGVQPEVDTKACCGYWHKACLHNGKTCRAADIRVARIPFRVERHDHIVTVIAASKKNADQCPITATFCHRTNQAKAIDSSCNRRRAQHAATGSAQKLSTGYLHDSPRHLILSGS